MIDYVKHCREEAQNTFYNPLRESWIKVADHIEKLEAALREIAALGFWDGDSAMSIANKALERKDD